MSDSNNQLVDPNSKISIGTYAESPDKAFAKAHSPAGYVGGAGSMIFMEGEGDHHDEYQRPDGSYAKGSGWVTGIPICDDTAGLINASNTFDQAIEQGKWKTPKEVVALIADGAGVAISATGVVGDGLATLDPASMGLQWAISWLLLHVRPFRAALDGLVGNPDVISAYASSWGNIAQCLDDVGSQFSADYQSATGNWTGDAHDAYVGMADSVLAALGACAKGAAGMKTLITAVGEVVTAVRGLIISLIGVLAGEVLDFIEAACGFEEEAGSGTVSKIATTVEKVLALVEELAKVTGEIMNIVGPVAAMLGAIDQVVQTYCS